MSKKATVKKNVVVAAKTTNDIVANAKAVRAQHEENKKALRESEKRGELMKLEQDAQRSEFHSLIRELVIPRLVDQMNVLAGNEHYEQTHKMLEKATDILMKTGRSFVREYVNVAKKAEKSRGKMYAAKKRAQAIVAKMAKLQAQLTKLGVSDTKSQA